MDKSIYKSSDFVILWDNVLVKPIKLTSKDGFKRPQQEEDKSEIGEIITIGLGIEEGIMEEGDTVLFNKYSSTKTDLDDNLIIRAEDIVAVLIKNKNDNRSGTTSRKS